MTEDHAKNEATDTHANERVHHATCGSRWMKRPVMLPPG